MNVILTCISNMYYIFRVFFLELDCVLFLHVQNIDAQLNRLEIRFTNLETGILDIKVRKLKADQFCFLRADAVLCLCNCESFLKLYGDFHSFFKLFFFAKLNGYL